MAHLIAQGEDRVRFGAHARTSARTAAPMLTALVALILSFSLAFLPGCSQELDYGQTSDQATAQTTQQSDQDGAAAEDSQADAGASPAQEPVLITAADGTQQPALDTIPAYNGAPYLEINDNQPTFTDEEKQSATFEEYAPLDKEGRCGTASALVSEETMPTEDRGDISEVHPSGWQSTKYDFIDGKNLYNRCHLIGYQLTGENANEENLITGTRYLNTEGMLPFENEVDDYIEATDNHVLYQVTPLFLGDDLVARGVHMQAYSVEDNGAGVSFNVYCYNVEPGVGIDYATGNSWEDDSTMTYGEDAGAGAGGAAAVGAGAAGAAGVGAAGTGAATSSAGSASAQGAGSQSEGNQTQMDYVLNTNTMKFHEPGCPSVDDIKAKNKQEYHGTRQDLIDQGYSPCGRCKP